MFTRSTKQIMTLLSQLTLTSSTKHNLITSMQEILYFIGLVERVTIMENSNGYSLTYICNNPRTMTIQHNWSFRQLLRT